MVITKKSDLKSSPVKAGKTCGIIILPSKREDAEKKYKVHKIVNLMFPDMTPFGWSFENFYDAREFLKNLANKMDLETEYGGLVFKSYSNLTTKWIKESELGNLLWVIRIDPINIDSSNNFPMSAQKAYGNKIARAIMAQNIWDVGRIEVVPEYILSESETADMQAHFIAYTYTEARVALFQESIAEANDDLERLI